MSFEVQVGVYEPTRKANPFDGVIAQVLDQEVPAGKFPSGTLTIPVETALSTAQAKIREAARDAGVKARIRKVDEESRVITFSLHDRKTTQASPDETSAPAEDEAPGVPKKG